MFSTIEELYKYLDSDVSLYGKLNFTSEILELKEKLKNESEKQYCDYEFYAFQLPVQFPLDVAHRSLELFDDLNFKYIETRSNSISNPKYRARYNYIIWLSKYRHNKYGMAAIDNFLLQLEDSEFEANDNLSNHSFNNVFSVMYGLSQSINYRQNDIFVYLKNFIGSGKLNGYAESSILRNYVTSLKKINREHVEFVRDYTKETIEKNTYPDFIENFLKLAIVANNKLSCPNKQYQELLGDYYIEQAKNAGNSFASYDYYIKALGQFKSANNKHKFENATVEIERLKPTLEFKLIKTEITDELLNGWWDKTKQLIDDLIENNEYEEIYAFIILYDEIIPKSADLYNKVIPTTFNFINVMNFDLNKNLSGDDSGINTYHLHITNFSIPKLSRIIRVGINSGKITCENFIQYLKENTWYGYDFKYTGPNGKKIGFDWVEIISPSLCQFFEQTKSDFVNNTSSNDGYVLAIDSLVLKFEGLFREFSRIVGAQTIEYKNGTTQERISFEMLLENQKMIEILPEDDRAFFKYLFTGDGLNLRNNIAHCFYNTEQYSPGLMLLLLSALLKLGNYKFQEINDRT